MTTLPFDFAKTGSAQLSPCGLYRYTLDREVGGPGMPLCFVMLNPSTADASVDDPTLRRCIGFARSMGRSRVRVVNLFAFRTPYPEELKAALARGVDIVGLENDRALATLPGTIVCAWGPPKWPFVRARIAAVVKVLEATGLPLFCLGTAKDGSPRHPLMLPAAASLTPWSAR